MDWVTKPTTNLCIQVFRNRYYIVVIISNLGMQLNWLEQKVVNFEVIGSNPIIPALPRWCNGSIKKQSYPVRIITANHLSKNFFRQKKVLVRIQVQAHFGSIVHRLGYHTVTVMRGVRLPLEPLDFFVSLEILLTEKNKKEI